MQKYLNITHVEGFIELSNLQIIKPKMKRLFPIHPIPHWYSNYFQFEIGIIFNLRFGITTFPLTVNSHSNLFSPQTSGISPVSAQPKIR
jgi:hypothetical protein